MFDLKTVKTEAKLLYKNNRGKSVLPVLLIFGTLFLTMNIFLFGLSFTSESVRKYFFAIYPLYVIGYMLITMILVLGTMVYFYKIKKGVCSGFKDFWKCLSPKSIGLFFYIYIRLLGWALLFMFAFIIAQAFSLLSTRENNIVLYSILAMLFYFLSIVPYAFYIQKVFAYSCAFLSYADNPKRKIKDIFKEGVEFSNGNKFAFFLLNLSFIGWTLLSFIFTFGLLHIFVFPYQMYANINAWETIKNENLKLKNYASNSGISPEANTPQNNEAFEFANIIPDSEIKE